MDLLAEVNPTPNPAGSPLLCATWDIAWTTGKFVVLYLVLYLVMYLVLPTPCL